MPENLIPGFPRPLREAVDLDDWTNWDKAFLLVWESLAYKDGLDTIDAHDCPLSDLEVRLLWEAHTRRGPFLSYDKLRDVFPR